MLNDTMKNSAYLNRDENHDAKEIYTSPSMTVILFETADVLTTSNYMDGDAWEKND